MRNLPSNINKKIEEPKPDPLPSTSSKKDIEKAKIQIQPCQNEKQPASSPFQNKLKSNLPNKQVINVAPNPFAINKIGIPSPSPNPQKKSNAQNPHVKIPIQKVKEVSKEKDSTPKSRFIFILLIRIFILF